MATSPILGIQYLNANHQQPEIVINQAIDTLETSSAGVDILDIDVTGLGSVVLTDAQSKYKAVSFWGAPLAGFFLEIPNTGKKSLAVLNDTGSIVSIKVTNGVTTLDLPAWSRSAVVSDGSEPTAPISVINQDLTLNDGVNINVGSTNGTRMPSSPAQKLGLFGVTPVVQQAAIPAPTGGTVVDVEARAAIVSLISSLATIGINGL